jgi:hypothetical protein
MIQLKSAECHSNSLTQTQNVILNQLQFEEKIIKDNNRVNKEILLTQ